MVALVGASGYPDEWLVLQPGIIQFRTNLVTGLVEGRAVQ